MFVTLKGKRSRSLWIHATPGSSQPHKRLIQRIHRNFVYLHFLNNITLLHSSTIWL